MVAAPRVLHVGTLTPISSLDPRVAHDFTGHLVLAQVFESPMRREGRGYVPVLLDGPLRSRTVGSQRVYTARVHPDARFSDGTPLLADDIIDAIRHVTLPEQLTAELVAGEIHFHPADPNLRPEDVLSHRTCAVVRSAGGHLLGTGPFKIDGMDPTAIRLSRNPHARRQPGVDGVEIRCFRPAAGGRPESLLAALAAGDVDFTLSLSRDDVADLVGVRKVFQAGMSTAFLSLNTERPHFARLDARRAVAASIDRYQLAELCYSNPAAFVARCLLPPGLGRGNDHLRHDPVAASQLLASAPLPTTMRMIQVWGPRPYLSRPSEVASAIVAMLAPLRTSVEVRVARDSGDYFHLVREGDYDLVLGGWIADTPDPIDYLESTVGSVSIPVPSRSPATTCNYARWSDPEVDELLATARRGRDVGATCDAIVARVADQVPLVPLMYGPRVFVHAWRVKGFSPEESIMPDLSTVTLDG